MSSVPGYIVEIVFCIDCTGSMTPIIEKVKKMALSFNASIHDRMHKKGKRIDSLGVRVIGFRDFWADGELSIQAMPDFVKIPEEESKFETFVKGITATGGGDAPESSLEAMALAIQSHWADVGQLKGRRIIVLWTDAAAHPFSKAISSKPANYPLNMPKDLNELTDLWLTLPNYSRRLLLYAPEESPWNIIGHKWEQTIHFPSRAGEGLKEHEFDAILDAIANSI